MTMSSRKALVMTAACAALIAVVSVIGSHMDPRSGLATVAGLLTFGGDILAAFLGLAHRAHGFPNEDDLAPYVFTFLLWWAFLYFLSRWWRRRGVTSP